MPPSIENVELSVLYPGLFFPFHPELFSSFCILFHGDIKIFFASWRCHLILGFCVAHSDGNVFRWGKKMQCGLEEGLAKSQLVCATTNRLISRIQVGFSATGCNLWNVFNRRTVLSGSVFNILTLSMRHLTECLTFLKGLGRDFGALLSVLLCQCPNAKILPRLWLLVSEKEPH